MTHCNYYVRLAAVAPGQPTKESEIVTSMMSFLEVVRRKVNGSVTTRWWEEGWLRI
jgi:hypothetical protein